MAETAKWAVENGLRLVGDYFRKLYENWTFEKLRREFIYSKEDDGAYWRKDGTGPYCGTCLDVDHRVTLLVGGATRGVYSCPLHDTTHWMRGTREGPTTMYLRRP